MNAEDRVQSYANAFFETALTRWIDVLAAVAAALERDSGLKARLQAPDAEFADRQLLLNQILPEQAEQPTRNFCYTLLQHGDLGLLPDIIDGLRRRLQMTEATPLLVEVTSAVVLAEDQRQLLLARLRQEYREALDVRYHVDPKILGGLILRVGDKLVDGSLSTRLAGMRQALGVTARE